EKRAGILVCHHPDYHDQRTRDALLQITKGCGHDAPALGIVPAIQPYLATLWRLRQQRARGQTLHPRRPFGIEDAELEGRWPDPETVLRSQCRDRQARIVELMPTK